ncbi:MAG: hypothetical protein ACK5LC_16460 [Coprobacillaceae bacterium]
MDELEDNIEYVWNAQIPQKLYQKLSMMNDTIVVLYNEEELSENRYLYEFLRLVKQKLSHIKRITISLYATCKDIDDIIELCKQYNITYICAIGSIEILENARYIGLMTYYPNEIYERIFDKDIPISLFRIEENKKHSKLS